MNTLLLLAIFNKEHTVYTSDMRGLLNKMLVWHTEVGKPYITAKGRDVLFADTQLWASGD